MPRIEQVDKNVKRRVGKLLAGLTDEDKARLGWDLFDPEAEADPKSLSGRVGALEAVSEDVQGELQVVKERVDTLETDLQDLEERVDGGGKEPGSGDSLILGPTERFVATEGQTDFVLEHSAYEVGKGRLWVFRNGVLQTEGESHDYVEVDETTVRFNDPLTEGETVVLVLLADAPAPAPGTPGEEPGDKPNDETENGYASIGITDERLDLLASVVRATNHSGSRYFAGKTMVVDPLRDLEGIDMELSHGALWRNQGMIQTPKEIVWEKVETATKPPARYIHSLTYDSARGVVVLFGGNDGSNRLNDTWEYDGTDWKEVNTPTKPPARERHSLTYDSTRGVVVMFGGYDGSTRLNDTWEYDGTDWKEVNTPTKPPTRETHSLTYDSARGVVVLFGGYNGSSARNDTWEYDGTDWREVNTPTKPSARRAHSLTYDSARGVVVLFGGYASGTNRFNDTWEYDGTDWREINTPTKPPTRQDHTLTYDSARGVVVLFGGYTGSIVNDTWEYDGTDWRQLDPAAAPSGKDRHAIVYDSQRGVTVLFGGFPTNNETWELTYPYDDVRIVTKPVELEKSPKAVGVVTSVTNQDDSFTTSVSLDDGQTWLELNQHERVPLDSLTGTKLRLKFEWTNNRALKLNSWGVTWDYGLVAQPGEEVQVGTTGITDRDLDVLNYVVRATKNNNDPFWVGNLMAVDSLADLSGIDTELSSRYQWKNGSLQQEPTIPDWVETNATTKPPARYGHSLTYDSARGVVVLFGGTTGSSNFNDTWEYDGTDWRQINTPTKPPARTSHSLTYDSTRGVVVMFGGYGGSRLNDTWEYDGTDWKQVNTPTKPPARDRHSLTYDSARGVVVLFGGVGSSGRLDDTWEYDGTDWRQINTPTKPPSRERHSLTYDTARGVVVLFGGYAGGSNRLNDTWEYDGTNWRQINTQTKPPARQDHSLTYDTARGVVVLFGGYGSSGDLNDTWEYDGTDWKEVNTPTKPSAREHHSLTYDSARGVAVLFGGYDGFNRFNDTWELTYPSSLVSITTKPIRTDATPQGIGVVSAIEGDKSTVNISISRDDGQTWLPLSSNQRIDLSSLPQGKTIRLKYEWENPNVKLHAWGVTWDYGVQPASKGGSYSDDLLIQNTVNLAKTNFKLNSHLAATREKLSGMIVDVFSDLSGIDLEKSRLFEYDETLKEFRTATDMVWEEKQTDSAPPARYNHSLTYDSARGVVVLFGGYPGGNNYFDDTWEYDGTNWRRINTSTKPPGRIRHSLTYDSIRGVVVLFGGWESSGRLSDTWEYDGTDWRQISTPTKPPGRNSHSLTYDSARGVVVLFGGVRSSGRLNDTWEYDGTDWREIHTPTKPPARDLHSLTYDSARGVVVLFGGHDGSTRLNDTWEYWNNVDPGEVVSVSDMLDTTPSQLYFVPHHPDGVPTSDYEYFLSLDGGETWFPITPEQLIDVPSDANKSSPVKIAAKVVIPPSGRLSGWAYGWV